MATSTILLIAIPAVVLLWVIFWRNQVKNAWSQIDVQLKRRYDLIPNLVETVKGYAKHERETLEKVTQARNAAMNAHTPKEVGQAENVLQGTLKSLFALSENYPDLKANQNFLSLQDDLKDAEDKIQAARRFYNANVRDFNTKMEVFPNNVIAKNLGFGKFEFFEIGDVSQRENVQVKF